MTVTTTFVRMLALFSGGTLHPLAVPLADANTPNSRPPDPCGSSGSLTRACCSPCWCCGFLRRRSGSTRCTAPRGPTLRGQAAGPAACSHRCRVCSTAWKQTHRHREPVTNGTSDTRRTFCSVQTDGLACSSAGSRVSFLRSPACLKRAGKKKKILIQLDCLRSWKRPKSSSCPKRSRRRMGGAARVQAAQHTRGSSDKRQVFKKKSDLFKCVKLEMSS